MKGAKRDAAQFAPGVSQRLIQWRRKFLRNSDAGDDGAQGLFCFQLIVTMAVAGADGQVAAPFW
jgi:hypothetical protein